MSKMLQRHRVSLTVRSLDDVREPFKTPELNFGHI